MNPTKHDIAAIVRHSLTAGGGAGLATSESPEMQLISVLATLAGLIWAIIEKRNKYPPGGGGGAVPVALCLVGACLLVGGCTTTGQWPTHDQTCATAQVAYAVYMAIIEADEKPSDTQIQAAQAAAAFLLAYCGAQPDETEVDPVVVDQADRARPRRPWRVDQNGVIKLKWPM